NYWEAILTASTTMLATFLGAWYAFSLTEKSARRRDEEKAVEAANRVVFSLIRIRNNLATVRKQIIEPHRSTQHREYFIQPTASLGTYEPHGIVEMHPFADDSDPLLLNEVMDLEMEIVTTLEWMDRRSAAHLQFQERLDAASISPNAPIPPEDLVRIAGSAFIAQLKSLTDQWIQGIDDSIDGCDNILPRLSAVIHRKYPSLPVLRMSPPKAHQELRK
ncbi:MAG TPA: hypothetical protein VFW53_06340, partial [Gallionella sp.]|nr:hypothetical protein [Gallionella sp.]